MGSICDDYIISQLYLNFCKIADNFYLLIFNVSKTKDTICAISASVSISVYK